MTEFLDETSAVAQDDRALGATSMGTELSAEHSSGKLSAPWPLESHLLNLHVSQEPATAAALCEALSAGLCFRDLLRISAQRYLGAVSAGAGKGVRRSEPGRNAAQASGVCRVAVGHRRDEGNFPVSYTLGGDRRF